MSSTNTEAVATQTQPTATPSPIPNFDQMKAQILQNPHVDQLRQFVSYPSVSSFVAGGVAGAVSRTVVSPFERMKIIFQIQGPGSTAYQGVIPTLTKMWRDEGWRGFMRGNGINCIRIFPYSAVQFSSYTVMKAYIIALDPGEDVEEESKLLGAPASKVASSMDNMAGRSLTTSERLFAGSLAGVASVAITYPLDLIRTRLSIQTASIGNLQDHYRAIGQKPPGIVSIGKQIFRNEGGYRALYRGIIPTTMGVAPYVGINFAVYEWMRERIAEWNGKEPSALEKLGTGAASGAVAQTLTYPFDVLRRRFQVVSMDSSAGLGFKYTSVGDAFKTILRTEGLMGLYKGLSANLLKVVPSMAASWASFEYVKDLLAY